MKEELKEFALEKENSFNSYDSPSDSNEDNSISHRKSKKLNYQKISIWDRLNIKRNESQAVNGRNTSNFMSAQNTFFDINKDYQHFLSERKTKQSGLLRLEKELTVTQEKRLVLRNQALKSYVGLIKL